VSDLKTQCYNLKQENKKKKKKTKKKQKRTAKEIDNTHLRSQGLQVCRCVSMVGVRAIWRKHVATHRQRKSQNQKVVLKKGGRERAWQAA